jgi:RNA polymerase sigma-54 factor
MSNIELSHNLDITQSLELLLSPRMIQMLKVLNLSYVDLLSEINEKTEENVMLELEKPDRLFEYLKHISSEHIPKSQLPGEDLPGIETIADTSTDLPSHLLQQLDLEDITDEERRVAEMMIGNIDENGYLKDFDGVKEKIQAELSTTDEEIEDALALIQTFEPEGVGARSLKECLLIQIREYEFESAELEKVLTKAVENHLEDLANKDFNKIAKALKIPKDGVNYIADFIKNNLSPDPAARFNQSAPCVIPSFFIKKEKDKYVAVNLEKRYGPVIKISGQYEKMLRDPKTDAKTVEFLKNKLTAAKDFLENIEKRHKTIEKIMERIIHTQKNFFEKGEVEMTPLMQKDIADELGLHPSTISRAISNKHIQTPKGVFRLKFLCPRDIKGLTSKNIGGKIGNIIKNEAKSKPLTDSDIMELLKTDGINIKRRTVAAYRKKLGIGITGKRVKF